MTDMEYGTKTKFLRDVCFKYINLLLCRTVKVLCLTYSTHAPRRAPCCESNTMSLHCPMMIIFPPIQVATKLEASFFAGEMSGDSLAAQQGFVTEDPDNLDI